MGTGSRSDVRSGGQRTLVVVTFMVTIGLGAMMAASPSPAQDRAANVPVAQADTRHDFDIPAQPLTSALVVFGQQSGLQVTVDGALVRDLSAPGVWGTMSSEQALQRLLSGTGLNYSIAGGTTVAIHKAGQRSDGVFQLNPVRVEGQGETAYGPVDGYVATRSATGTKTDTPIMEVPASVQVVPRQVIEDQGALNLKDVYENVSGVQQAGNTLNAQTEVLPIIRGFESPTLLRNGLRSTQVGAVDLVNVERVEVLKGPASILYGALEPGGIVNYITKRPQATAGHTIEQQIGSYDFYRTTGDLTGPLSEDGSLLYRLNAAYTNSGSFRDHIDLERIAVTPSLLWQPTRRTELLVDLSYLREKQPYDAGIPLSPDGKPLVSRDTFFGDPDLAGRTIDDYLASYQVTYDVNAVWSVRNQFQLHRADAKNESIRPRSVTGTPGNEQLSLRYQNEDRRDDELQVVLDGTANFATGALDHTLLLGAELIAQETDFRRYRQNIPSVAITDDPVVDFTPPANQPQQVILGKTRWGGLYAQDQLSMLQEGRLKLLIGGRFDIVHQENKTDDVASPDVDDRAFSGRGGLLYQLSDQYSAYVSVSQSFNPQSPGTLDADGTPLDPEKGLQYEAGMKGAFLGDRLLATASIFQIEKTDVAVFDQALFNATGQIAYFPGVEQRSRGFEFNLAGTLTEQIRVIANYSYTATKVLENPGDPATVGGPLGGVPKHKARLWLTYNFDEGSALSGLGFGGGFRYVGKSSAQFDSSLNLDPYVVVDAGAWYSWKSVKLGLNVYNIFDEDYIVRASNQAIAHPGQPFTVIGSASVRF